MKKDWTKQEVENLTHVIKEHGRTDGIKLFAKQSGRTENSVRIKWSRFLKEDQAFQYFEGKPYTEEECYKDEPSWWHKVIDVFHKIWQ